MGWQGKLIGTVLGAIIGRGLARRDRGIVIGHLYDAARARDTGARGRGAPQRGARPPPGPPAADLQAAFFRAVFEVMGHVAKADGA